MCSMYSGDHNNGNIHYSDARFLLLIEQENSGQRVHYSDHHLNNSSLCLKLFKLHVTLLTAVFQCSMQAPAYQSRLVTAAQLLLPAAAAAVVAVKAAVHFVARSCRCCCCRWNWQLGGEAAVLRADR